MRMQGCEDTVTRTWLPSMKIFPRLPTFFSHDPLRIHSSVGKCNKKNFALRTLDIARRRGGGSSLLKVQSGVVVVVTLLLKVQFFPENSIFIGFPKVFASSSSPADPSQPSTLRSHSWNSHFLWKIFCRGRLQMIQPNLPFLSGFPSSL